VDKRFAARPVVALLGARQVGKTTLARSFLSGREEAVTVFDLERPSDRLALSRNPEQILSAQKGVVVIDEIQRLPELFALSRPLVDAPDREAKFLL
jgi:predicted AAA+ superfamily ATPase